MLKLYKNIDGILHYWETWDKNEKTGIVHWGIIGQKGQDKEVKSGLFSNFRKEIQKEVKLKMVDGYQQIEPDDHYTLLIEFKVVDMGTPEDVDKRHRLENKMNEALGWTGLGDCDGGSIGSGTMEVCCFVVDFETAKKVIEETLKDNEFSNYSRIYDENAV
ncbi:MAG: hypothetical protein V4511_08175 [Bacteroidota bacterium]